MVVLAVQKPGFLNNVQKYCYDFLWHIPLPHTGGICEFRAAVSSKTRNANISGKIWKQAADFTQRSYMYACATLDNIQA